MRGKLCYQLRFSEGTDPVILLWYPVWESGETLTFLGGCKPRVSLFMVRVTYACPSLGVFGASKAMDLGLPAIVAIPGPVGHDSVGPLSPCALNVSTPASREWSSEVRARRDTPSSPRGDCAMDPMGGLRQHGGALQREPGTGAEEVS